MTKVETPRWGCALTGSGHFFKECLAITDGLQNVDLFVSKAAAEVARMDKQGLVLPKSARVFGDTRAGAAPVGQFHSGVYRILAVARATSSTVARCVFRISDTLATDAFSQTRTFRVASIVFACETAAEPQTEAPKGMVYPRRIGLDNAERSKSSEATDVVQSLPQLEAALARRRRELGRHG
jgi:dihydromethanopterin reductase (acceptor)